jgi:RNA polymerase sigma-70 factor (ECF subfamily)
MSEKISPGGRTRRELVGNALRFEDIYSEHVDFVWKSVRHLGVTAACTDDVVQQIFLIVYRRLPGFSAHTSLKGWIFAIVVRVVSEHRRSLRRKSPHNFGTRTDPETVADSGERGPHASLLRSEAALLMRAWLEALDADKREVFVLAEIEELTAGQIADATGVPVGTVYSRLRAARREFSRMMRRRQNDN